MVENQVTQNPQFQQPNQEASVSMQIQQLLVQQQQYQQKYNQLVAYVKQTPNLPIEEVNQIKVQLDQLNALFVQWKQQLQSLWYTQIQVNKPVEVKSGSKNNFSFKKLAIWCGIVLLLILAGFFVTLVSLKKNPEALVWIWFSASSTKSVLQLFAWLLFGSIIILMLWLVVSNIYKLATIKNQSKLKNVGGLMWWILGLAIFWVAMALIFIEIGKIETNEQPIHYWMVWPYLIAWKEQYSKTGEVEWIINQYKYCDWTFPLIAPSEIKLTLNWDNYLSWKQKLKEGNQVASLALICGNQQWQKLELNWDIDSIQNWSSMVFNGWCFYWEKWEYIYSVNAKVKTATGVNEVVVETWTLNFVSEIQIKQNKTIKSPINWEFILWKVPVKFSIDTTQVFRDLWLWTYHSVRYLNDDAIIDMTDKVSFDYTYLVPQVYYPAVSFPDLNKDLYYVFPIRTEQSDVPVCDIKLENLPWTTKYSIYTDFVDKSSESMIKSYSYNIVNNSTDAVYDTLKDKGQNFTYTFPEKWAYKVVLNFITIDDKQWKCESDVIQLQKETFNVQYTLLSKDLSSSKYTEKCSSQGNVYDKCTAISLDSIPQSFQLQLNSITPSYATTKKVVYLDDKPLFNDEDTYNFDLTEEWTFTLKIMVSDSSKWIDEQVKTITFTVKKPDIVGSLTITSPDSWEPIDEWFEPLTVILDASKTEINIPWDEIVYFTWDFGDWEIKQNQQNWVMAHTYNYDYTKENGIFKPKVTIKTKQWYTKQIESPVILNVKKWLVDIELSSTSHPTRQAPVWKNVSFQAEFDWLPETMTWDFWDGSPVKTCPTRSCAEVTHSFKEKWTYSVKLTLEFDAIQKVDKIMEFKVYE